MGEAKRKDNDEGGKKKGKRQIDSVADSELSALMSLSADLKNAAATLGQKEVRYLVDLYYIHQEGRKRAANQIRALEESEEPVRILEWVFEHERRLEDRIKGLLRIFAKTKGVGEWSLAQHGVGPVISAGLLAHIDIDKAPNVGHIWSFAGLNPKVSWVGKDGAKKIVNDIVKGKKPTIAEFNSCCREVNRTPFLIEKLLRSDSQWDSSTPEAPVKKSDLISVLAKRPWNAALKTLCWHFGECIKRTHNSDKSFYGPLYAERKAYEIEQNRAGAFVDNAVQKLEDYKIGKTTDAYAWYAGRVTVEAYDEYLAEVKSGKKQVKPKLVEEGKGQPMLPPAHLDRRACRWVTKLFLSHWHHVAFVEKNDVAPPRPYILAIGGHSEYIAPPEG